VDGKIFKSGKHGGSSLFGTWYTFNLSEDEYIMSINGRYGGSIDSIQIYTNKKS